MSELQSGINFILDQLMQLPSAKHFIDLTKTNFQEFVKRKLNFEEIDPNEDLIPENQVTKTDHDTSVTKTCQVIIKDVRKHPWWGPKVRQLSGEKSVIRPPILKRNYLDLQKLKNNSK